MKQSDFPEARRVLFVNQAESLLLTPEMVPFAMTTAPYTPSTITAHNPYSKPYLPREYPPVVASPEEMSAPMSTTHGFRGFLERVRARWAGATVVMPAKRSTGVTP